MKGFYLTIFGVLLAVSIIRFTYGTDPLTFSQLMVVIEDFPLDVKEDFNGVVYEFGRVRSAIETFTKSFNDISSYSSLLEVLDAIVSIFKILWSICLLILALVKFLLLVVKDLIILLIRIFSLFFGVSPTEFEGTVSDSGFGSNSSGSVSDNVEEFIEDVLTPTTPASKPTVGSLIGSLISLPLKTLFGWLIK